MKTKQLFTILISSIGTLVFFVTIFSSTALNQVASSQCSDFSKQQVLEEKVKFYQNIDRYLSSSNPNTDIAQGIFEEYRSFLSSVNQLQSTLSTNFVTGDQINTSPNAADCQNFINQQKQLVQNTIQSAFQRSNSLKQSFTLIEKYAQINQQFSDLKVETDQVSQKIQTFSQKLPCYSEACVQD